MTKRRVLKGLLSCAVATFTSQPVAAQIDGEWAVTLAGRPVDNIYLRLDRRSGIPLHRHSWDARREPVNFHTPKLLTSLLADDGVLFSDPSRRLRAQVHLDGMSEGLTWSGWWYIADGVAQPRWLDRNFSNDCGEGFSLYPSGANVATYRPHRKIGQFNVRFNAAENTFSGSLRNNCRPQSGVEDFSAPISGRRIGPAVAVRLRPIGSDTLIPRLPRLNRAAGSDGGPQTLMLHLNDGGRTRVIELSKHYRISPNSSDALAADRFELEVRVDQDRRPMRLRFQAIEFSGPPIVDAASRTTILRGRLTGRNFAFGLPFVGVPRSGQSIFGLTYSGAFCGAFAWIPVVEFGDIGRDDRGAIRPEAEQTTMLWPVSSSCGARTFPAQVPDWAVRS